MNNEFGDGRDTSSDEALRKVDLGAITDIVSSEAWHDLVPNFPKETALLPRDLRADQVAALVTAVANPELTSATSWERAKIAFQQKDVQDVGHLDKVGGGEGKVCYVLTTPDGKEMAVLLRGYGGALGSVMPEDPKMIMIKESPDRNVWEYSDLRTYALFPVTPTLAVQLQEFGGKDVTQDFGYDTTRGDVGFAQGKAAAYVHGKGRQFTIDRQELSHPRHALFNKGLSRPPAIIDVPVVQHK